ncbi:SWR1 complex subunit 2 isoform X2 [Durio zibethinus]|uniref:SWR1 complex subunit 2 isoform X2 n=1 Tax=Durio zibethinus TaxID=66656 RepID=A0A6P5WK97_DURZI|nr:SWR1 complex subunit 2 isoform X2 [Durio zibethinus]XP_022716378.1 SWR1 complex subunit 2 isoform X2 [Durio zibethinus]
METAQKGTAVFVDRASRSTRGRRMTKLLDEEVEEDESFWNQEAFKEEENDANYEEEPEVADVFDSDFDEDEPEPDEEVENEADERVRTKKRLIFPGKPSLKKKKKKKVLSKLDGVSKDENLTQNSSPQHHDTPDDAEGERIIRKSTRTSVIVRQAEREALQAALQATMKPIKRKKEGEEKRMTQEEMLLEAAQTEIMNLRNLERVLAREEEVKKRAIIHKAVYNGPQIKYVSKDGSSYLEFSKGSSFHSELSTTSLPCTEIQRQGYVMQPRKPLKLFKNVFKMNIKVPRRKWIWVSCLIPCLVKVQSRGRRDLTFQIEIKHHVSNTWGISTELHLMKMKIQSS